MTNTFDQLTHQYALSKTLRFELKPLGNTSRLLEDHQIIEKDRVISEKYEKTKPYIDRMHRDFVTESLKDLKLTKLETYFETYLSWKADKKLYDKHLKSLEVMLREQITRCFDLTASKWAEQYKELGLKNKNLDILFEADVFSILKVRYGHEDDSYLYNSDNQRISIFDSWKDFVGYFKKFFETRKNFYKDDGIASAIATRIINHNLRFYCDNIILMNNIKDRISFDGIHESFENLLNSINSISNYSCFVLQSDIDNYNAIIGGYTSRNGIKHLGINEYINIYRQKTGEKIPYFKTLDRQILSEKEQFTEEISSEAELSDVLKRLLLTTERKFQNFRSLIFDLVENDSHFDLESTYITKAALNTISNKWTTDSVLLLDSLYKVQKASKRGVTKCPVPVSLNSQIR